MKEDLTHLDAEGKVSMVDVSDKPSVRREATARGEIMLQPETLALVRDDAVKKGNVLAVARIAGIQAAKQTQMLIPLCHQLPLSKVQVDFELKSDRVEIVVMVRTTAPTGVEMEALTAVSVAALTIYDMCKAVDKTMEIGAIRLVAKSKGGAN